MVRKFEIAKEVLLAATPEQVWEAIATGPGVTAWFMEMDLEAGGVEVIAADPPKRFAVRTPPAEDGATQAFEYLIEARDGGSTVLRFVHSGFLSDDWSTEFEAMTSIGWDMYLHTLGQYLRYFPGQVASFLAAEAPEPSAKQEAWPVLLEGLGVSATPRQGDQVRLTPDGIAPIEGVVDYATDSFLGIQTSDALYRFHGRWRLGMTIAAGHHFYGEAAAPDVTAEQEAWQRWLGTLFAV